MDKREPRKLLDQTASAAFASASIRRDWKPMFAIANANDFAAAGKSDLLAAGVGAFVLDRLDEYHDSWNLAIGGFSVALGLGKPGVEPTARAIFESWGKWDKSLEDIAWDNATSNLLDAHAQGKNLAWAWACEGLGIAWREAFLDRIVGIARTEPLNPRFDSFFLSLTGAPSVIPANAAIEVRSQRLFTLAGRGGLTKLAERQIDVRTLWKCWKMYDPLTRYVEDGHKRTRQVDAVELLLALLANRGTGRPWLAAKVAAVRGRLCVDCGEVLADVLPTSLRRVTEPHAGADKVEDYQLACQSCARQHQLTQLRSRVRVVPVPAPVLAAV